MDFVRQELVDLPSDIIEELMAEAKKIDELEDELEESEL